MGCLLQHGEARQCHCDGASMTEISERITLARVWLTGFITDDGTSRRQCFLEDGTLEDRTCRLALAQLLIDGEAPRELTDLLAAAIVPNCKFERGTPALHVGHPLERTGALSTEILPDLPRVLAFKRRTSERYTDPVFQGKVLTMLFERTDAGMSVETACAEVSELLTESGRKITARTVKGYWDDAKALRAWRTNDEI